MSTVWEQVKNSLKKWVWRELGVGLPENMRIGRLGEKIACKHLRQKQGWRHIASNFGAGKDEIDLIFCVFGKENIMQDGFVCDNSFVRMWNEAPDLPFSVKERMWVFIEVKTRKNAPDGVRPSWQVREDKKNALRRAIKAWLLKTHTKRTYPWRVDVVEVLLNDDETLKTLRHIPAIEISSKTIDPKY